ncbi:hypothetical protein ABG067_000369 [Albugo candida]
MIQSSSVKEAFDLFDGEDSDSEKDCIVVESIRCPLTIAPTVSKNTMKLLETENNSYEIEHSPWPHIRPMYSKSIRLINDCTDVGGNRGYIATEDLEPGTLILLEKVHVPWPADAAKYDPLFLAKALESILRCSNQESFRKELGHLFPRTLEDLPTYLRHAGRHKFSSTLKQLCTKYSELNVTEDELLQNIFSMQCNAFHSGVFLYCSLLNHDCNPNCVKFIPVESDGSISQVRVTKKVDKGQPLTISYLYPREQSRLQRKRILEHQFGFECTCNLCKRGDSEFQAPDSAVSINESVQSGKLLSIEDSVSQCEELVMRKEIDAGRVLDKALEVLSDALEIVAHDHFVLIRIYKLVGDCYEWMLKGESKNSIESAVLFVRSNYELLSLQRQYLGHSHVDLARTLNDLSQGIQVSLSRNIDTLLREFPEWDNFRQVSIIENQYRKEYMRIKELYD